MAVVESEPDQREDARRIADEPCVAVAAGRPRFSGEGTFESELARFAGRAEFEDAFEDVVHYVTDARRRHALHLHFARLEQLPLGGRHGQDRDRFRFHAEVREGRVGVSDFERGDFERPERHRRIWLQVTLDADRGRGLDHVRHARVHGRAHGGDVVRMRQRFADGDLAVVAEVVILRRPDRVAGADADRRIIEHRRGREGLLAARRIHRRRVDERLEKRSGLPARLNGAVELRLRIAPPADERLHVAGARLDGEDDAFERRRRLAQIRIAFVQRVDAAVERLLGRALHDRVERREHAQPLGAQLRFGIRFFQLLEHEVDEERRAARHLRKARRRQRRCHRLVVLSGRDVALLLHQLQNRIAAHFGAIRMRQRRQHVRRSDDAGQGRGFGQRQVRHVFAEVDLRGLLHAGDLHRSVLAEVDLVEVRLEDLLLAVASFEQHRHEHLVNLAWPTALRVEEEVFDELLRQRRTAVRDVAVADVGDERTKRAADGDPFMMVEVLVFGRDNRLAHDLWHGVERDRQPVFHLVVVDGRNELRLDADSA